MNIMENVTCNHFHDDADDDDYDDNDGCVTPKHESSRIPVSKVPPPPPKRKRYCGNGKEVGVPKHGYFKVPDLNLVFIPISSVRKEACA